MDSNKMTYFHFLPLARLTRVCFLPIPTWWHSSPIPVFRPPIQHKFV